VRVVLDTNVVISALLHPGTTRRFQELWRTGKIKPLVSQAILEEYIRVLHYPKFGYEPEFIAEVLGESLLPWLLKVEVSRARLAHPPSDKDDEVFLRVALSARADALVSGDPHLTILDGKYHFPILPPATFLSRFFAKTGK
jgi:putative PIN family toxin of toxin-antitoxin system